MKRLLISLIALLLTACQPNPATLLQEAMARITPSPTSLAQTVEPAILALDGFLQNIHDPAIAREGDTYYVFSTGSRIIIICSKDMRTWELKRHLLSSAGIITIFLLRSIAVARA
jgi:hypothetical protein